jgi:hypothetical protein
MVAWILIIVKVSVLFLYHSNVRRESREIGRSWRELCCLVRRERTVPWEKRGGSSERMEPLARSKRGNVKNRTLDTEGCGTLKGQNQLHSARRLVSAPPATLKGQNQLHSARRLVSAPPAHPRTFPGKREKSLRSSSHPFGPQQEHRTASIISNAARLARILDFGIDAILIIRIETPEVEGLEGLAGIL